MKECDFYKLSLQDPVEMSEALHHLRRELGYDEGLLENRELERAGREFDYSYIVAQVEVDAGLPFLEVPQPIVKPLGVWIGYFLKSVLARRQMLSEELNRRTLQNQA